MSTLPVIRVRGNAFEMGQQIGRAVQQAVLQVSVHIEEFRALESKWLGSDYLSQLLAAARRFGPRYVRELEGMADGIGLPFERLFVWNCRGDLRLPDGVSPATRMAAADGCTTLLIPADPEAGQPHVIAHNEDGSDDLHGHCCWLSATPDDGLTFESYLYPGMMPGHTLAVNGVGLVQTINNIRVQDLQPGIPRHYVCRAILDCQSLDQATDILRRTDRASGFHHSLGQAGDHRLLSVEAPASGCDVREISKPAAHANHLVRPCFAALEQTVTDSSAARQKRASRMVDAGLHVTGGPQAILFDRADPGNTILRTPGDGSDDYGRTLVTGVFEIGPEAVDWTLHDGPENLNIRGSRV